MKKVQPLTTMMMNDNNQYQHKQFAESHSELTTRALEERESASHKLHSNGTMYRGTGDLEAGRRSKYEERRCSCGQVQCHPISFENMPYKMYTKELLSNHQKNLAQYGVSTFDKDMKECRMQEKVNRLKAEGMARSQPTKKEESSSSAQRRTVRFDTITIREYSVRPGVNPGGTKGCPLTIDWKPIHNENMDLDVFDTVRSDSRRRCIHQLKLLSAHRQQMLTGLGFTMRDVNEGTKAANIARRNRFNTIARLKSSDTQEMLEGLRSNVQNLVTFGTKKRKEQKLLAPYKLTA